MTTRIKAELETVMQQFTDNQCEQSDWPKQFIPETIHQRMAEAAYAVLMVSMESAHFTESQ